ncbi:MAG: cation diffusion facilitator family transporter, partial [Candidatus Kariarchaeaceae archaeon]
MQNEPNLVSSEGLFGMDERVWVAFSSVIAAVFLTGIKLVVGIWTGSLGILSEALHSALDLIAAVITFFAVKSSKKPADHEYHYGYGKIES